MENMLALLSSLKPDSLIPLAVGMLAAGLFIVVYWVGTSRTERDGVQKRMQAAGVPTAVHYPKPLHLQPAYTQFCCPECCPLSVQAGERVLSLPMSADLSDADLGKVVSALQQACA